MLAGILLVGVLTASRGWAHSEHPPTLDEHTVEPWSPPEALQQNGVGISLTIAPYLQIGTDTGIHIRWRTSPATDSLVSYGTHPTNLTNSVSAAALVTDHELTITGLTASTRYYYSVGDSGGILAGGDTNHTFKTMPVTGSSEALRIWVLGDSGSGNIFARNVRDAFYSWSGIRNPDLWIMLGDNAYNSGTDGEYISNMFSIYPDTLRSSPLWLTLGNHDGFSASSATQTGPYYDLFSLPTNGQAGGVASGTEAYYSFDVANIHFICLNSFDVDRATNGAMLVWAEADLAANTQEWTIAFFHHPPYSKGSHDSDNLTPSADHELVEMRENALPILEAGGVDLVLSGHSHSYERSMFIHDHFGFSSTFDTNTMASDTGDGQLLGDGAYNAKDTNGTVYVVAGSSSRLTSAPLNHPVMITSLVSLGSLVLDIDGSRLDATFIRDNATQGDTFTIIKDDYFNLTLTPQGSGFIQPNNNIFSSGTVVHVTATPANFFTFSHWTNGLSGTNAMRTVTMTGDQTGTTLFNPILVTNRVPQWWLDSFGLGTNDSDALSDQDSDGQSTWQEYVANTSPNNSNLFWRVTAISNSIGNEITFQSAAGRIYTLEHQDDLDDDWTETHPSTTDIPGTGSVISLIDTNESLNHRRYRIQVELMP